MEHLKEHPPNRWNRHLLCSYCLESFADGTSLVKHITEVHLGCEWQCPLCFYRAASSDTALNMDYENENDK